MSDLIKVDAFASPIINDLLTEEEIAEQLDGIRIQYPRFKVPAGGALVFEDPCSEDPANPEYLNEIVGVIVDHFPTNAYWPADSNQTDPPACASVDGKTGIGTPGGNCKTCPLNAFGSGEGGIGKACKNSRRLYLLRPNELIPVVINIPATSMKEFDTYLGTKLIAKGIHPSTVVTRIKLKKANSKDGISYALLTFAMAERFEGEAAAELKAICTRLKQQIRATEQNREAIQAHAIEDAVAQAAEATGTDMPF